MSSRRPRRRRLALALALAAAGLAAWLPAGASAAPAAAGTCASGTGAERSLHIRVRLEFHSPRMSTAELRSWASLIESSVERQFEFTHTPGGADLEVDVQTNVRGEHARPTPGFDQIELHPDADWRDTTELGRPNRRGTASGDWSASRATDPFTETDLAARERGWAHEVGHLLGLDDHYEVYVSDASGREVVAPRDIGTNGDLQPAIAAFARAHGLDPATARGHSRPEPGHENDIMANAKRNPNATFTPQDLRALLSHAGRCERRARPRRCHGFSPEIVSGYYGPDFLQDAATALPEYLVPFTVSITPSYRTESVHLRALASRIDPLKAAYRAARAQAKATYDPGDGARANQAATNLAAVTGEMGGRDQKAYAFWLLRCPGYRPADGATKARVESLHAYITALYDSVKFGDNAG
jgi:hypothetical protein